MVMAYFYYRALGNTQLAAIGLLSFAAVAQLAPAFFGGLFWRRGHRARRHGRHAGRLRGVGSTRCSCRASWRQLTAGLDAAAARTVRHRGAAAAGAVRHRSAAADAWRALVALAQHPDLCRCSRWRAQPSSIERLQADLFVPHTLTPIAPTFRRWRTTVTVQDIQSTVAQYLGPERAAPGLRGLRRRANPAISNRPRRPISSCCSTPSA